MRVMWVKGGKIDMDKEITVYSNSSAYLGVK